MVWTSLLLTNPYYGYPNRGDLRRIRPIALACLHVTANPNSPPATALDERDNANDNSAGPTAHTYVNRTGGGVHAIETRFAAWNNGGVNKPKTAVPGVQAVLNMRAAGFNANEAYVREIEFCGRYNTYPITQAQVADVAALVAADSLLWDLPINRSTVHLHSDLDTVNRPNCPVPAAQAEAWVAAFITAAQEARAMTIDELLAELKRQIDALEAERDTLKAGVAAAEKTINVLLDKIAAAKAALG